jgi:hypothetical protein
MFDYHRKLADMGQWQHLHRKNNPALNPLHNGKDGKKNGKDTKKKRKNRRNKGKHGSRKSDKKKSSDMQSKQSGRFPPTDRLRSKAKKGRKD